MAETSFVSYLKINAENYRSLIDELLSDVAGMEPIPAPPETIAARAVYIETAIAKGTPLKDLPLQMNGRDAEALMSAAQELPDKQGKGNAGIIELTAGDRKAFALAAEERSPRINAMLSALFPDGKTDMVIPFFGVGMSATGKIDAFIERHNARARRLVGAELGGADISAEMASMLQPERQICRQMIRRDPRDPSNLQTCKPQIEGAEARWTPKETDWTDRTRVGKYLQDLYEWELYEVFQYETNETKKKEDNGSRERHSEALYKTLREIANREKIETDALYDAGDLEIVATCDPQKVGEESTGQRWISCMAKDGCNYVFVTEDIACGTIAAYVVFKGDAEARWPPMRVLIKPFANKDGEIALVPANRVYGSSVGSSRTSDALFQTLNSYVSLYNAGKSGNFVMDGRLYADAQATVVNLQNEWSEDGLVRALTGYQDGSVKEWLTEIATNNLHIARNEKGAHNEDPVKTIKGLKSSIRRLYDGKDSKVGLMRMFFRTMLKTSIGAKPKPLDIAAACRSSELWKRHHAFKALSDGDYEGWKTHSAGMDTRTRQLMTLAALMTSEAKGERFLPQLRAYTELWADDFQGETFAECIDALASSLRFKADAQYLS
ncbi:MAG: hypothetical protein PHE27_05610, partial [Alphaproteobacteria bacterium]|nr:hypothetical protein [Alphaproteobacteria bacterium]